MRRTSSALVTAALALTTTFALPALQAARAGDAVPFHGTYTGTFSIAFGPTSDLRFSADGTALHVGDSHVDAHATLTPVGPTCFADPAEAVTLTAANGDTLSIQNSGTACLDFSVPGKVFVRTTADSKVLGGTGRFDGASGSGTAQIDAEILQLGPTGASGALTLTFDGTISY